MSGAPGATQQSAVHKLSLTRDKPLARFPIPACRVRAETTVQKSLFIATIAPVFSVDEAREFIHSVREEFQNATHHVPAYLIGHGASVIAHCTDDGEPSGTAGRPALAVLTGSGLGDVAVVTTRFFGGVKLGTGGLVRAYSDAVRSVLAITPLAEKVLVHSVMVTVPYNWYERLKTLIDVHGGEIIKKEFSTAVSLTAHIPVHSFEDFSIALREASHASLCASVMGTHSAIIPISRPSSLP